MAKALQTKLTREQKYILKGMRRERDTLQNAVFFQAPEKSRYTLLVMPACDGLTIDQSSFVKVAIAYQGSTEEKFRAKAGLYHAANRMLYDQYIVVTLSDMYNMIEYVFDLSLSEEVAFFKG